MATGGECIYCGKQIVKRSKEHIIQNALGGLYESEDGKHHSTKMWYCRLYHILMLQHLDAWDMPNESTLRKLILQVT